MKSVLFCFRLWWALFFATGLMAQVDADPPSVIWWVAGDSHVGHRTEAIPGEHLDRAVADVNQLGIADYAIMLGDLVEDREIFGSVFVRTMNQLNVGWMYVLGNHDFDRDTGKPVLPPMFGGRTVHGIRFIFLSDEVSNRNLAMSDAQEQWFWEELDAYRGNPVFLFTHQPHDEVEIWPRLKEVLDDYNIVAWFSAHKHNWNIREDSGDGFVQVNIHAIRGVRDNHFGTFLWLERIGNTAHATVRFRNHRTQRWIQANGRNELTFSVDLNRH